MPLTRAFTCGGERTRTADFYVANVALYQLSYTPLQRPRIQPGGSRSGGSSRRAGTGGGALGLDCMLQIRLEHGRGHVGSRSFDHCPQSIGSSAKAPGDGVGILDSDEEVENLLHRLEELLAPSHVTGTEAVEQVTTELGRGLGQSVQPGRKSDRKLLVRSERFPVD